MESPQFKASVYDVIIVGARCAGAAAAMLLARAGLRVLALDRQLYGSDTLSTHALMRPAVVQLARWGLLERIVAQPTPVINSTSFHYGVDDVVTVPIEPQPGLPGLVAPRRTVLDRVLVDAATKAGAEIVHQVTGQALLRDSGGRVAGIKVRCANGEIAALRASLVIGADGLGSVVAREVEAPIRYCGEASAATIYLYARNPGLEGSHWHFRDQAAAGIVPTNDNKVCVFASFPTGRFDRSSNLDIATRHHRILQELVPSVAEHIASTGCSTPRGFRGAYSIVRQAYGPGWLLVGDAGLFRDPLTAHGISDALRDAEGAALAVLSGSDKAFADYQQERDTLAFPVIEATEAICSFAWTIDELKKLHKQLSDAMKQEVSALLARPISVQKADGRSAQPCLRTRPSPEMTNGYSRATL